MDNIPKEPLQMEFIWFDCDCKSPEHAIRFVYDPSDATMYFEMHLPSMGLLRRIAVAFKYIIRYRSINCFSDCIISNEDVDKMIHMLERKKLAIANRQT